MNALNSSFYFNNGKYRAKHTVTFVESVFLSGSKTFRLYLGKKQVGGVLWAGGWVGFAPPVTCLSFQLLPIERAARKQKAQEAVAG